MWLIPIAAVLSGAPYAWFTRGRQIAKSDIVPATAPAQAAAVPHFAFRAEREPGDWRLTWDRDAVAKLDPVGAMVNITDGGMNRSQFLSAEDLASGFLLYVPHSADILFRLKVSGKDGDVEEQFRVLGLSPEAAPKKEIADAKESEPKAAAGPVAAPASEQPRKRRVERPVERPVERVSYFGPHTSPEPVRMIAAAWPASVPRVAPVQVRVRVWVDAAGRVTRAAPEQPGAGRDRFVESAMAAARGWSFRPAMDSRHAVPSETVLTFHFKP